MDREAIKVEDKNAFATGVCVLIFLISSFFLTGVVIGRYTVKREAIKTGNAEYVISDDFYKEFRWINNAR